MTSKWLFWVRFYQKYHIWALLAQLQPYYLVSNFPDLLQDQPEWTVYFWATYIHSIPLWIPKKYRKKYPKWPFWSHYDVISQDNVILRTWKCCHSVTWWIFYGIGITFASKVKVWAKSSQMWDLWWKRAKNGHHWRHFETSFWEFKSCAIEILNEFPMGYGIIFIQKVQVNGDKSAHAGDLW